MHRWTEQRPPTLLMANKLLRRFVVLLILSAYVASAGAPERSAANHALPPAPSTADPSEPDTGLFLLA